MAVIASMAMRYLMANSSMSYVLFQQVDTSQGIMHSGRACMESVLFHTGRSLVVEFLSTSANFRSYIHNIDQLRV